MFTGTVIEIAEPALPPRPPEPRDPAVKALRADYPSGQPFPLTWRKRLVRMQLGEVLTGVDPGQKEIEIVTGMGGGDCGYSFGSGVAYVIYAYKNSEGRLETGICSRTRPLTEAAEDVAYFHGVPAAPETGEVRVFTSIPGVRTAVDRDGFHSSVTTDVAGRATLGGLLPGEYKITTERDGTVPTSRTVQLRAKGCAEVRYFMQLDLR